MNVIKSRFVYHLMAIITVAIWGTIMFGNVQFLASEVGKADVAHLVVFRF